MEIVSKFVVGSDEGVADFFAVEKPSFLNLYKEFVSEKDMQCYIDEHFDVREKINELNNLSNQLIITYQDNTPVGYGLLKGGSRHPKFSEEKRTTEMVFAILPQYHFPEIQQSLWNKCFSAAKLTDVIWTNVLKHDPLLHFLKKMGFNDVEDSHTNPFSLPSSTLVLELKK
ncbi:hypothetical protein [Chryseobacterium sp. JUb7]|uniref:hypothetical protein n=1 Tax=Chryseobacterium sp. JUb7 TaxID=2940599 RepID=UPI002167425B|nr:hypothetical protein [Chryseobacterium sp. JUb7]MCS3531714.1 hypothetical protein [Chryseobacterium sp. JUb7]